MNEHFSPDRTEFDTSDAIAFGVEAGILEESLKDGRLAEAFNAWFIRAEAMRIAAREGHGTDELRFAGFLSDTGEEVPNQTLNTAADIASALAIVMRWRHAPPGEADLREVWEAADASNQRINSAEAQWTLDQAFSQLAARFDVLLSDPTPEKTARAFYDTMSDTSFGRRAQRFALVLSPHILRRGLGLNRFLAGVAKNVRVTRAGETADPEELAAVYLGAAAAGARDSLAAMEKLRRLRIDLEEMLSLQRRTTGSERAVDFLMATPVANTARFAKDVGLSGRGALHMIKRLEKSGCISQLHAGAKNRVFVCHKALNL